MLLKRHHLSELWNDITDEIFADLKASIEKSGQRYPIIVFGDEVLDGWHRYQACLQLKIDPQINYFTGTRTEAADLVNDLNGNRRHTTSAARAMAIVASYEWAEASAEGTGDPRSPPPSGTKSNAQLAAKAHTSERTVQRTKKILSSGSDELKKAVKAGKIGLRRAAEVTHLPQKEQLAAAKELKSTIPDDFGPDCDTEYQPRIDRIMAADDKLAAMSQELKRAAEEIVLLSRRRDGLLNENGALSKLLEKAQRRSKKLEGDLDRAHTELQALRERVAIMDAA